MRGIILLLIAATLIGREAKAQGNSDTRSIEQTVLRTLELISAPSEEQDWEAFRLLFLPSADLIVVSDNSLGQKVVRTFTLEEFVRTMQRNTSTAPFKEVQLKLEVDQYNGMAQAFQSYEVTMGEKKHKGINSFQLVFEDQKWWIANIVWASDLNGVAIPEQFMPAE